jgi:predicted kinase
MTSAITIPKRALVVLCGPSAVGKSTWSRAHFTSSQIIASDRCRQMVSDDLNWHEPLVSDVAFDFLYHWVEQRLRLNRLAVVDSTALMTGTRQHLLSLAQRWHAPSVLVVCDADMETCLRRDRERADSVGLRVLRRQFKLMAHERRSFHRERWDQILEIQMDSEQEPAVHLVPLPHERPDDQGPFDIIGDVHGCREELEELLLSLGWEPDAAGTPHHPEGRRLIFLGDLSCGGPDSIGVWDLALRLRDAGRAELLAGDHDVRFARLLRGEAMEVDRGLEMAAKELMNHPTAHLERITDGVNEVVNTSPPHLLLDRGRLAVTHAALADHMIGKTGRAVRDFCRHGEGPRSPHRGDWVRIHRGTQMVVHGHTPTPTPRMRNHTLSIDTGCVLGGALTALRWPEHRLVQVQARATHWGTGWTTPESAPQGEFSLESVVC